MTTYEHAMLGIDAALAAGLYRRYGWQIVAWSGIAASVADWDGLTLLFGAQAYDAGHRIWGHNLLVAGVVGFVVGAVLCRTNAITHARRIVGRWIPPLRIDSGMGASGSLSATANNKGGQAAHGTPNSFIHAGLNNSLPCSAGTLGVWGLVGVAAAYTHLALDVVFSHGKDLGIWGLPLLWPFSARNWAYPMVPWGDPGTTIVFALGMFAMVRWKTRVQGIALTTLIAVAGYILIRGWIG